MICLSFQAHKETCPDKVKFEKSVLEIEIDPGFPKKEKVKYEVVPPGWKDDENWDGLVGTAGYNPQETIVEKPVIRKLVGATAKEKRKFYDAEQERFEKILGIPMDPLPKGAIRVKKEKPPKVKKERDPNETTEDGEIIESSESGDESDEYEIIYVDDKLKQEADSDSDASRISKDEVLPEWEPIGPKEIIIGKSSDSESDEDDFLASFIKKAEHKREKLNPKKAKQLKKEEEEQKHVPGFKALEPVKPSELPEELRGKSLVANPFNYHWRDKYQHEIPKKTKHPLDRLTSKSPTLRNGSKASSRDRESVDRYGRVRRDSARSRESIDSQSRRDSVRSRDSKDGRSRRKRSTSSSRDLSAERRRILQSLRDSRSKSHSKTSDRRKSSRSPTASSHSSKLRYRSSSEESHVDKRNRKKHKKHKHKKVKKEKREKNIKTEIISPPPGLPALKKETINLEDEEDQLKMLDDLDFDLEILIKETPVPVPPQPSKPTINPFSIKKRKEPNLLSLDHIKREFASSDRLLDQDSDDGASNSAFDFGSVLIKQERRAVTYACDMLSSLNKNATSDRRSSDSQHSSLRENSYEDNILPGHLGKRSYQETAASREGRKKRREEDDDRRAREDSEERYLQEKLRILERIRDREEGYENMLREISQRDERRRRDRTEDFF